MGGAVYGEVDLTDDLLRVLKVAAKFALARGAEFPADVRVDMIKTGIFKTYEFFLGTIKRLVRDVYGGYIGGEFIDIMANLIQGQINQAYQAAWNDEGTGGTLPAYLVSAAESMIVNQFSFVDGFYRAAVDARVDGTSIDPLLSRAELWANQFNSAYNDAVLLIRVETGGNLQWREGDTLEKCPTCLGLDGIVMSAKEWEELGVHPAGFPNDKLKCKGGHCLCSLSPTEQRRSPNAYASIMNIIVAGTL